MFHQEQKDRFIMEFSTSDSRRHAARVMFNVIAPFEEQQNKDICAMDKDELSKIVADIVGYREISKKLRMSILKEYFRWCIKNGVEGAGDAIFDIKCDVSLEKLKRQMVANPQHLQRYLNCICEKESEQTVDNIYRCLYWLAYAGVDSEEEALKILDSDVDLGSMVVKFHDREFPIYREAIPAFKNCKELKGFWYKHPCYEKVLKSRVSGHELLRGTMKRTDDIGMRVQTMRVAITSKIRERKFLSEKDKNDESLDLKLSFYRVQLSGMFYRMYESERAGMRVDFTEDALHFMEGKVYKLDSGRNQIGAKQRQIANSYLEDYNRWKEAYSI